jgi:hypothetical protein
MQTWKDEMQYIYAGQATFPEDVDPWSQPNKITVHPAILDAYVYAMINFLLTSSIFGMEKLSFLYAKSHLCS